MGGRTGSQGFAQPWYCVPSNHEKDLSNEIIGGGDKTTVEISMSLLNEN